MLLLLFYSFFSKLVYHPVIHFDKLIHFELADSDKFGVEILVLDRFNARSYQMQWPNESFVQVD